MTEQELIEVFKQVMEGEKQRVQKAARTCTKRQLEREIHGTRTFFSLVHPQANEVVDHWISEVING